MFVGSTLLSTLDRLSIKTVNTGKTGSLLGLLGSAAFIIVAFVLFIGPVIYYFQGDYIQGLFHSLEFVGMQLYAGCDFKMAIAFYNKQTDQLANHTELL